MLIHLVPRTYNKKYVPLSNGRIKHNFLPGAWVMDKLVDELSESDELYSGL